MVAAIIALVAVLSFILGAVSLKSRDRVRFSFSIFSFVVAAWVLANFVFQVSGNKSLVRSLYALGALAICAGLIFAFNFVFKRIHPAIIVIVSLVGIVNFYLSLVTDLVIMDVDQVYTTGYKAETGPYFLVYSLFIVAGVLTFFGVTLYQRRRAEGVKRNQIGWIMTGFGLFGLVTAVVSFVLPLFGVWNLTSFDSPSAIFFVLASFYAITRYRLLDLRIVIRKSFFYFMLAVFVFLVYYLNVYLDQRVFGGQFSVGAYLSAVVIAPLFLFGFSYLSRLLQKFANKYFFTGLYDPQETIKEFADRISQTIKLDGVATVIIETIQNALRVDSVAVALREPSHAGTFSIIQAKGFAPNSIQTLNSSEVILKYSQRTRQPIVIEEMIASAKDTENNRRSEAFRVLARVGVAAVLPLALKDRVNSIVVIGKKATKEAYTKGDIALLGTLANQASVAVENARLYNSMEAIVAEQTRDIQDKNEHLKELLKMKSEFLSIASHQLRTPLTAVRGLLAMQADGDLDQLPQEQRREEQRHMLAAANHLNNIVNDLLDAMELEGGQLKLTYQPTDLAKLVEEAIEELKPDYDKKGLTLSLTKPKKGFPKVEAEPKYLLEAIMDVIDNAEKYTNKGGVTVTLAVFGEQATIAVKDTGIGIPKSDFPRLFKKFSRGEQSAFQHANGSGLGLFIIRNIMHQHHGEVSIASDGEGKGTTVTLTLPLRQLPSTQAA